MKRKFVTEYAIGYMNSYTAMLTAHQLMQGGEISESLQSDLSKCHIYIIAARPLPYFKHESLRHENNKLSGTIGYRIAGEEKLAQFNDYRWKLEDDAIKLSCEYPYREIKSLNAENKEVTYLPASYLTGAYISKTANKIEDLDRYEVLYVGQAFGNQGGRSAIERLRSHSTLQKILALTSHEHPDKEIMIFMYGFEHSQIISSIDGRAKDADNTEKNETRLFNAMSNPPDNKQKIGMIEAGLIRYFKPAYNEIFKTKFPSTKHKVLESCRKLDISGLVVELDSSDLNLKLYSQQVTPINHHIIQIDLVSEKNRQSFFFSTGFPNNPEVIK
jgi:hypothetical protein